MMEKIFRDVRIERQLQDLKWGVQNHGDPKWSNILGEEVGEVHRAILEGEDPQTLRDELVQVIAVSVAWIECMDRRGTP